MGGSGSSVMLSPTYIETKKSVVVTLIFVLPLTTIYDTIQRERGYSHENAVIIVVFIIIIIIIIIIVYIQKKT
jgi:hypothetical protein